MTLPPPLVPASDRLPSREEPRGQTEQTHLDRVRGSTPPSSPVGDAGDQAKRPGPKRAGARGGGSAASLRCPRRQRQDREQDRPAGEGSDEPPGTLGTPRTALHIDGQHPLAQVYPAPARRGRATASRPCGRGGGGMAPRRLRGAAQPPAYRTGCTRGGGTHAARVSNRSHGKSWLPVVPSGDFCGIAL